MLEVNANVKTTAPVSTKSDNNKKVQKKDPEQKEVSPSVILDLHKEANKAELEEQAKNLTEKLNEQKAENEKKALTESIQKSSSSNEAADTAAATKKTIFDMLVKRARLLFPHQYDVKSWKNFTRDMKEALQLSTKEKDGQPDLAALDRAISLMQGGMSSLKMLDPSEVDGKLREMLPTEEDNENDAIKAAQALVTAKAAAATASAEAAVAAVAANVGASVDVDV